VSKITLTIRTLQDVRSVMTRAYELVTKGIQAGPVEVVLQRISKSRIQEEKYHAMIGDIAKTVKLDLEYDLETWKALLVDEYAQELKRIGEALTHPGKVVVSLDKERAVTVRPSTKKFRKKEASGFIEFLYMWGSNHGARFSEKSLEIYEEGR
jgi:hypothetical protein